MLLTSLHPAAAHRRGPSSPTCKDCRRSGLFSVFLLKFTGTGNVTHDPGSMMFTGEMLKDLWPLIGWWSAWCCCHGSSCPLQSRHLWTDSNHTNRNERVCRNTTVCVFIWLLLDTNHKFCFCYFYFLARMSRNSPKPPCETNKAQLSSDLRNQRFCRK